MNTMKARSISENKALNILLVYLPFILILILIGIQNKIPIRTLVIDIFTVAEIPSYTGLISNIGLFIWCVTLTTCFFTSAIIKHNNNYQETQKFLFYAGCLTSLLLLDDFFLLHERFFQTYFHIPEKITFCVYGNLLIFYLIRFRKVIWKTDFTFLVLALVCFGSSLFIDTFVENYLNITGDPNFRLLEEGSKLLGIVGWSNYLVRVCFKRITSGGYHLRTG